MCARACGAAAAPMGLKLQTFDEVPLDCHILQYGDLSGSNGAPRLRSSHFFGK